MQLSHLPIPKKPILPLRVFAIIFSILCLQAAFPFFQSVMAATPVITNITAATVTNNGATITWKTDVISDTQIEYGLTTSYGSSTTLNTTRVTDHTQSITGLQANQLYHYKVKSRDASGDLAVSGDRTFITTLGSTTPGTSTDSGNSNTMNATRFTTGNGGKVASLNAYVGAVDTNVANRSFQIAIYTANGTTPGTLIASSQTGTLTANSWNSVPVNATLNPNTNYFLAYNSNGTSGSVNNLRYSNGGTSGWSTNGQAFGTWPANFGQTTAQGVTFALYASFLSDTIPPTVNITSPVDGATVSGIATVTANATDEYGVAGVQFKLNGNNLGSEDTTAPYEATLDTTKLVSGTYTLTATASDSAGNTATSATTTINVSNPPKITVTTPTAGQTIEATTINITYTKSGDWVAGDGKHAHFRLDGGPTKMDFDADNNQSYTLADVPAGTHTLEAIVANGSHVEQPETGMTVSFTTIAPDVTAPTVSLTSPAEGATVLNTVTLTADAADETGIVGVQFLLDGNNIGAEDTTAPYSINWDTLTTTNGNHTLTARAPRHAQPNDFYSGKRKRAEHRSTCSGRRMEPTYELAACCRTQHPYAYRRDINVGCLGVTNQQRQSLESDHQCLHKCTDQCWPLLLRPRHRRGWQCRCYGRSLARWQRNQGCRHV